MSNASLNTAETVSTKEVALADLFVSTRLQTDRMTLWHWCLFILYFPVGCMLSVLRFFLVFLFAFLVPAQHRYRVFRLIGGLHCTVKSTLSVPDNGALILTNHSNYLDPIVVNAALAKPTHLGTVIWHGVNFFSRIICRPTVAVLDKGNNRDFLERLMEANKSHNMIVFPEGAVTDSCAGLLQFQRSVFRLPQPIFLMAISYRRAFPFLQGKAMSKAMGFEVLVDLFQPWTQVELIPLGEFTRDKATRPQLQADSAQRIIADALGLVPSRWNKNDRHNQLFTPQEK